MQTVVDTVRNAYDGKRVSYSTHFIHTNSNEWQSVVDSDPYFEDVCPIGSLSEFVTLIQKDRYLTGLEVARYILSKISCTHTRLEKLVYFCYADYLCSTGKRLFGDCIYAFEHGPVVESVYSVFQDQSRSNPCEYVDDDIIQHKESVMPIRSRLIFAEDGQEKVDSIDRTLSQYSDFSTSTLIGMTHREGSPWSYVDCTQKYAIIPDDLIRRFHSIEV